jgi:hypothetical protein
VVDNRSIDLNDTALDNADQGSRGSLDSSDSVDQRDSPEMTDCHMDNRYSADCRDSRDFVRSEDANRDTESYVGRFESTMQQPSVHGRREDAHREHV